MEPLFRLFDGLQRLGPGSEASTLRALRMLPAPAPNPRVLEFGCGTGAATLVLARETGGHVTAVDVHKPFLDDLERRARQAGLADRIATRLQSMDDPGGVGGKHDLIWSEGAIYLIGFERGLRLWKPLLKPGGYICVSEATWLTSQPTAPLREYWAAGYPEMGTVSRNLERARAAGFDVLGSFTLPRSDWEVELYEPLQARIDSLRSDPAMSAVIAETEREIELYAEHGDSYGYVFYLLRPSQ